MKKIVAALAMLALIIGSAFAIDISASIEIGTGIELNTEDMGKSKYFTAPNYDDIELNFGIESDMFGAYIDIGADEKQSISMYDAKAWIKLGSLVKITIGDFSNRNANFLTSIVDEYDLGILRYGSVESGFDDDNTIEGDKLNNFVVDFYLGPATIQFGMNPYMASDSDLNVGGRIYADLGDFAHLTITTVYDNNYGASSTVVGEERTTIGAFVGFPNLVKNLGVMAGYTASIKMNDDKIDHGIDLRAELPLGDFAFATHHNLSLYGDEEMVLYNELGGEMLLTGDMVASLALRSQLYTDGVADTNAYDLGILLGFDYTVSEFAMISTGVEVTGIANKTADVIIGIPLTLKVWY